MENFSFQILHGREAFSKLLPELEALESAEERIKIWSQAISLSEFNVQIVVRNQEDQSIHAFWPFSGHKAIAGMQLRALGCSLETPADPLLKSDEATMLITLMEGLEVLLSNYRWIHIPALQKVLTQDILRPYFVRRQIPRKIELISPVQYSISLYQNTIYGKLNMWFGKS